MQEKQCLLKNLTRALENELSMAVVTNDIYTKEDAKYLMNHGVFLQTELLGSKRVAVHIQPFGKILR